MQIQLAIRDKGVLAVRVVPNRLREGKLYTATVSSKAEAVAAVAEGIAQVRDPVLLEKEQERAERD